MRCTATFTASVSRPWTATSCADSVLANAPIENLDSRDLAALEKLLDASGLPTDDCQQQLEHFCAIHVDGELIAAGGLEPAGDFALLRSIVVRDDYRGRGLAGAMTEHLLQRAERRGLRGVYLLTETARDYFLRHGFTLVARDRVPAKIACTRQFASLCPDSADCLQLSLPRH